jgi:hypothetical protein
VCFNTVFPELLVMNSIMKILTFDLGKAYMVSVSVASVVTVIRSFEVSVAVRDLFGEKLSVSPPI